MLLRRIARPLLAGIFISGGIAALRDPKGHEQVARPLLDKVTELAPTEQPISTLTLVRVDGGVKLGFGILFAVGKAPRVSAAVLAATLVPTTAAGHRFWELDDPDRRRAEQIQFTKNLGLLGGLLLAAADTEGKPSLFWRARRAKRTSAATAQLFHRDVTGRMEGLGQKVGQVEKYAGQAAEAANRAGELAADRVGGAANKYGPKVADAANKYGPKVVDAATRASELAVDRVGEAANKYGPRVSDAANKYGPKVTDAANKYGPKVVDAANRYAPKVIEAAERAGDSAAKASARLADEADRWLDEAARLRSEAEKQGTKKVKQARKAGKTARREADKRATRATSKATKKATKKVKSAVG